MLEIVLKYNRSTGCGLMLLLDKACRYCARIFAKEFIKKYGRSKTLNEMGIKSLASLKRKHIGNG